MISNAVISPCGEYRYLLERIWDSHRPMLNFIMLNPSTADHKLDDPTIRRCINFAQRDGYGGIYVTNLFAYRTFDPKVLYTQHSPCGPDNVLYVQNAVTLSETVCAAWGANKTTESILPHLEFILGDKKIYCLGTTKNGAPRHPLYVKGDQPFIEYDLGDSI